MLILALAQGKRPENNRAQYFYGLWPGPAPAYFMGFPVLLASVRLDFDLDLDLVLTLTLALALTWTLTLTLILSRP